MSYPLFGIHRIPSASPKTSWATVRRWFVFRIREKMYTMTYYGVPWGFTLTAVEESMEQSFDEWCGPESDDKRFSYVRLDPHPTDDALNELIQLKPERDYVPRDQPERAFIAKHCPQVLEAAKADSL